MNNLLSYCGLVDARISASEKHLPVISTFARGFSSLVLKRFAKIESQVFLLKVCVKINPFFSLLDRPDILFSVVPKGFKQMGYCPLCLLRRINFEKILCAGENFLMILMWQ